MLTLMPPGVAISLYVLGRGWVTIIQTGDARQKAVTQLRTVALAMLLSGYLEGFGAFVFVHYIQHQ